jgi:hypothetical protein
MVAVVEMSWQDVFDGTPLPESPVRQAFRKAVEEVAQKAREALPEANGRIDSAVKIVLQGDVEILPDGKAKVASQSNGQTIYHVVNGECSCKDFVKAPGNFCKHRLSAALYKRSTTLAKQKLAQLDGTHNGQQATVQPTSAPKAELPIPPQFVVELHGKQFVTFSGLLTLAHERGLASLKADFITVTTELALAHAVATFADGRTFEESADATPANVNSKIRPHFPRMALTRSKARCLRDALNIPLVCLEELEA